MSSLSIKETDALANFEAVVSELCNKNIDKPEMFPSFNSIKNRECYLDDLVDVSNLAEEMLKKVRKRIEQVNEQQKEEIDKFDEQIKKLKQHNLEITGKLHDISDSLEKVHNSKQPILGAKESMFNSFEQNNKTGVQDTQQHITPAEIPVPPKPKQQQNKRNVPEKHREFGDILHLLDDSFSREILPIDEFNSVQLPNTSISPTSTENIAFNHPETQLVLKPVPKPLKLRESAELGSDWSIVAPRKHKKRNAGPYAQIYDTESMNLPVYKPVVIAGEYAIKAVICNDWPEITEMLEGCMYYVVSADHFAIKLCGVMLHGNIGEIYTNERNPVKIKECKFGIDCNKDNCEYYHDPLFSEGKKDIRNYIAGSFLYSPLAGVKPKSIGSRKIGSRSTIESDINRLDEYDIKLHRDQVMHDLLCCLLIPL